MEAKAHRADAPLIHDHELEVCRLVRFRVSNYEHSTGTSDSCAVTLLVNVWEGDRPEALQRSLMSISNQTVPPSEILLVADGPIGEELEEVVGYASTQIVGMRTIRLEKNHGLAFARNVGLAEASFDLLALHDADDVMHPRRIEIQRKVMGDKRIDVVCSGVVEVDFLSQKVLGAWPLGRAGQIRAEEFFWNSPIAHSSVMFRRTSVERVGGYAEVPFAEDYDLWLRLLAVGTVFYRVPLYLQALLVDGNQHRRRGGSHFVHSERTLDRQIELAGQRSKLVRMLRLGIRLTLRLGPAPIRLLAAHMRRLGFNIHDLETFLGTSPIGNPDNDWTDFN